MDLARARRERLTRLGIGRLALVPLGRAVSVHPHAHAWPAPRPLGATPREDGLVRVYEPPARLGYHDRELNLLSGS